MRRVGEVVTSAQGLAIARASDESHPDLGAAVLDENLETVGRVVDVFGPVERPYIAVSPEIDVELPSLLGAKLYAR
jgi:RNA-binding protein